MRSLYYVSHIFLDYGDFNGDGNDVVMVIVTVKYFLPLFFQVILFKQWDSDPNLEG